MAERAQKTTSKSTTSGTSGVKNITKNRFYDNKGIGTDYTFEPVEAEDDK
jgi:hypothetical protein